MLLRFGEDYMDFRPTGRTCKPELYYNDSQVRDNAIAFQLEYYIQETGRSGVLWDDLLWSDELPGLTEDLERLLTGRSRELFFQCRGGGLILWLREEAGGYVLRLRAGRRPGMILWTHTADRDTLVALHGFLEELAESYPVQE